METTKKALLLIDRGSREPEVKQELNGICNFVRNKTGYEYVNYCFLEVVPPFIEEGINLCVRNGITTITIVPYFLYPGLKLKDAVKQSARIGLRKGLKVVIGKPLSYHRTMSELINERIAEQKKDRGLSYRDKECDILIIGHGSSDRSARDALTHNANVLRPKYRNLTFCFLELEKPNIEEGIRMALQAKPCVVIIMPYFLHRGSHIKCDVVKEVRMALEKYNFKNAFITRHLGLDEKLVDLVLERAREVEMRAGVS